MKNSAHKIKRILDLPENLLYCIFSKKKIDHVKQSIIHEDQLMAIDWPALYKELIHHSLSVICFNKFKQLKIIDNMDNAIVHKMELDDLHAQLQYNIQYDDMISIGECFTENKITYAVLKGAAFREEFYMPAWSRLSCDIDILVKAEHIEKVRSLLSEMGFIQSASYAYKKYRPATKEEIQKTESKHYELAQFIKQYNLSDLPDWFDSKEYHERESYNFSYTQTDEVFYTNIDTHWCLHLLLGEENPLSEVHSINSKNGHTLNILKPEWSIFLTIFKLYFEVFEYNQNCYRNLCDLIACIIKYQKSIDWQLICHLVKKYNFQAAAFYSLSAAEELAGHKLIPQDIMHYLSLIEDQKQYPRKKNNPILDFGDFIPYLINQRLPSNFIHRKKVYSE